MAVAPPRYASVFELAKHLPNSAAFNRIFEVQQGYPRCKATPQLHQKYGEAAPGRGCGRTSAGATCQPVLPTGAVT